MQRQKNRYCAATNTSRHSAKTRKFIGKRSGQSCFPQQRVKAPLTVAM